MITCSLTSMQPCLVCSSHRLQFDPHAAVPIMQAAVSVARRVAEEKTCELGREVGYAVRFEERAGRSTRIKYLTGLPALYSAH